MGLFDLPGEARGHLEYFLFELGRFAAGDEVEYSILAEGEDVTARCGPFRFTVDALYSTGPEAVVYPTSKGAVVDFGPVGPYRPVVEMAFSDGRLHATFNLNRKDAAAMFAGTGAAAVYT
ncbi:MAG: hypothetical protein K6T59_16750, partial [Bryobacteraceae bacterium]|nr:hypothetical protein [Bryobacteraceae bacterium]